MEARHESKAAMKAAFDGLPFPPVRFLGAQYERLNTGEAGAAKFTNLRTLLQEAACARQRLHLLLRKLGDLTPEQQNEWDSSLQVVRDTIDRFNDQFSDIRETKDLQASGYWSRCSQGRSQRRTRTNQDFAPDDGAFSTNYGFRRSGCLARRSPD